ncbi:MAG: hypothetical protein ABI824_16770 [Acidobacteriota bacterium]
MHSGFVAMEYFAWILNRSFLVFMTDDGLRMWQFSGPISAFFPEFYKPIEELLDVPEMAAGSEDFNDLMFGPDTFLIPYDAIRSVAFEGKRKWGMGRILHSGLLFVELVDGQRREFILLGKTHGAAIRDSIRRKLAKVPVAAPTSS